MDDNVVGTATMYVDVIDGMPTSRGLYVGGVPAWMFNIDGTAASLKSLKGCVRDVVMNGQ